MIRVRKSLKISDTPKSLLVPGNRATLPARTTHARRLELIDHGVYIDEPAYASRYKTPDIKKALLAIYHGKCAFCEQWVEQWHVDHYRPKKQYPWLTYSWDNLLLTCPTCNQNKADHFEIRGKKSHFDSAQMESINRLAVDYQRKEQPMFIHPEFDDPTEMLVFAPDGSLESHEKRIAFTIVQCDLNRKPLMDRRRKIFEDFLARLNSAVCLAREGDELKTLLKQELRQFKQAAFEHREEFLAFRRFVFTHLMTDLIEARTAQMD